VPDTSIVNSLTVLLRGFADCFTSPSTSSFATLMTGWALDLRRHTIPEVVRAVGAIEEHAHQQFVPLLFRVGAGSRMKSEWC